MQIVAEFLDREDPSVKILHPWRKFDQEGYATRSWAEHMAKYLEDRERWLTWQAGADWARVGKWNGKPDTVGGLTNRLANHEAYHISLLS